MSQEITVEGAGSPGIERSVLLALLGVAACALLSACGPSSDDERFPPYDNTAEVEADWKSKPNFYQFKTPADVPANLKWENGMDLPEIGDPAAKKGGTFNFDMPNFPPTL
ncbi:MAG: hypothetical protein ACO1TE_16785, partial [Prosthecobacter sp.]